MELVTARNCVAARYPASCDGLDEEVADASCNSTHLYTGLCQMGSSHATLLLLPGLDLYAAGSVLLPF